jgi:hypothetical protein
MIRENLRIA